MKININISFFKIKFYILYLFILLYKTYYKIRIIIINQLTKKRQNTNKNAIRTVSMWFAHFFIVPVKLMYGLNVDSTRQLMSMPLV